MRKHILATVILVSAAAPALAETPVDMGAGTTAADDDEQVALGADIGATGGSGGTTPGGMRIGGHYLYRMTDHDWFDGAVAFTFGSPSDGCWRTPPDGMSCGHGPGDGFAGDLSLGLRRMLPGQGAFTPFVRGGVFGRVLRFSTDDVNGAAIGVDAGAGVAARVRDGLAVVGSAGGFAGRGWLGSGVGRTGQLGMIVTVGAEVRLP
jgi:hypothetical protein